MKKSTSDVFSNIFSRNKISYPVLQGCDVQDKYYIIEEKLAAKCAKNVTTRIIESKRRYKKAIHEQKERIKRTMKPTGRLWFSYFSSNKIIDEMLQRDVIMDFL